MVGQGESWLGMARHSLAYRSRKVAVSVFRGRAGQGTAGLGVARLGLSRLGFTRFACRS